MENDFTGGRQYDWRGHFSSSRIAWGIRRYWSSWLGIYGIWRHLLGIGFFTPPVDHFPKIGGPYAYSREAFGDFIGFQMAWSYWVANWVSNAAVSIAFVSYLSIFWPSLKTEPTQAFFLAVSAVWIVTFINICGTGSAGIVQVLQQR